jgi:hypothetical protein
MEHLTVREQRDIKRFVDANRHVQQASEVVHMKWIAECMELISTTKLANSQKRELVVALYKDLAKDDTNNFKEDFDAQSAVQFIWDTSKDKFGIVLRRKGCLASCMPSCCTSVSTVVEKGQVKVDVQ